MPKVHAPTFEQRDFPAALRVFFHEEVTYVEIVADKEHPNQEEWVARYSKHGDEHWLDYQVKDGDPPVHADKLMCAALDTIIAAWWMLDNVWLES